MSGSEVIDAITGSVGRSIVLAHEAARQAGHIKVGPEYLLLGLLLEKHGVASKTLLGLGVSREAVQRFVPSGSQPSRRAMDKALLWTDASKEVLERARAGARVDRSDYVGTVHVLRSIVTTDQGQGGQILAALGVDLAAINATAEPLSDSEETSQYIGQGFTGMTQAIRLEMPPASEIEVYEIYKLSPRPPAHKVVLRKLRWALRMLRPRMPRPLD